MEIQSYIVYLNRMDTSGATPEREVNGNYHRTVFRAAGGGRKR